MFGPVIEGARVRLEPPRGEDAALFQRWFADIEVTRYLLHRHPPTLRQDEDSRAKGLSSVLRHPAARISGRFVARCLDSGYPARGLGGRAGGGVFGPVIAGERVRLEPPRLEYAPVYMCWFADREVTRYLVV